MFASLRLRLPLLLLQFIVNTAEPTLMDAPRQQAAEPCCVGAGNCGESLFAPCPDHSGHFHTFASASLRPKQPALEHST
jgi:hypothetical protein